MDEEKFEIEELLHSKDYELSLWEEIISHYSPDETTATEYDKQMSGVKNDLTERKRFVFGGNKLESPGRAQNVTLVSKVTGDHTLTFNMYSRYQSYGEYNIEVNNGTEPTNGEYVINPYIAYLRPESKIKLKVDNYPNIKEYDSEETYIPYTEDSEGKITRGSFVSCDHVPGAADNNYSNVIEEKVTYIYEYMGEDDWKEICQRYDWYDFIIKKVEEDSTTGQYKYTATDLFINELARNGYNLQFKTDAMNNMGTAADLTQQVLKGTDWQYDEENSQPIHQYETETGILFSCSKCTLPSLTGTGYKSNYFSALDMDTYELIKIKPGDGIFVYYSQLMNASKADSEEDRFIQAYLLPDAFIWSAYNNGEDVVTTLVSDFRQTYVSSNGLLKNGRNIAFINGKSNNWNTSNFSWKKAEVKNGTSGLYNYSEWINTNDSDYPNAFGEDNGDIKNYFTKFENSIIDFEFQAERMSRIQLTAYDEYLKQSVKVALNPNDINNNFIYTDNGDNERGTETEIPVYNIYFSQSGAGGCTVTVINLNEYFGTGEEGKTYLEDEGFRDVQVLNNSEIIINLNYRDNFYKDELSYSGNTTLSLPNGDFQTLKFSNINSDIYINLSTYFDGKVFNFSYNKNEINEIKLLTSGLQEKNYKVNKTVGQENTYMIFIPYNDLFNIEENNVDYDNTDFKQEIIFRVSVPTVNGSNTYFSGLDPLTYIASDFYIKYNESSTGFKYATLHIPKGQGNTIEGRLQVSQFKTQQIKMKKGIGIRNIKQQYDALLYKTDIDYTVEKYDNLYDLYTFKCLNGEALYDDDNQIQDYIERNPEDTSPVQKSINYVQYNTSKLLNLEIETTGITEGQQQFLILDKMYYIVNSSDIIDENSEEITFLEYNLSENLLVSTITIDSNFNDKICYLSEKPQSINGYKLIAVNPLIYYTYDNYIDLTDIQEGTYVLSIIDEDNNCQITLNENDYQANDFKYLPYTEGMDLNNYSYDNYKKLKAILTIPLSENDMSIWFTEKISSLATYTKGDIQSFQWIGVSNVLYAFSIEDSSEEFGKFYLWRTGPTGNPSIPVIFNENVHRYGGNNDGFNNDGKYTASFYPNEKSFLKTDKDIYLTVPRQTGLKYTYNSIEDLNETTKDGKDIYIFKYERSKISEFYLSVSSSDYTTYAVKFSQNDGDRYLFEGMEYLYNINTAPDENFEIKYISAYEFPKIQISYEKNIEFEKIYATYNNQIIDLKESSNVNFDTTNYIFTLKINPLYTGVLKYDVSCYVNNQKDNNVIVFKDIITDIKDTDNNFICQNIPLTKWKPYNNGQEYYTKIRQQFIVDYYIQNKDEIFNYYYTSQSIEKYNENFLISASFPQGSEWEYKNSVFTQTGSKADRFTKGLYFTKEDQDNYGTLNYIDFKFATTDSNSSGTLKGNFLSYRNFEIGILKSEKSYGNGDRPARGDQDKYDVTTNGLTFNDQDNSATLQFIWTYDNFGTNNDYGIIGFSSPGYKDIALVGSDYNGYLQIEKATAYYEGILNTVSTLQKNQSFQSFMQEDSFESFELSLTSGSSNQLNSNRPNTDNAIYYYTTTQYNRPELEINLFGKDIFGGESAQAQVDIQENGGTDTVTGEEVATGKTKLDQYFEEIGGWINSAYKIVKEVVQIGTDVYQTTVKLIEADEQSERRAIWQDVWVNIQQDLNTSEIAKTFYAVVQGTANILGLEDVFNVITNLAQDTAEKVKQLQDYEHQFDFQIDKIQNINEYFNTENLFKLDLNFDFESNLNKDANGNPQNLQNVLNIYKKFYADKPAKLYVRKISDGFGGIIDKLFDESILPIGERIDIGEIYPLLSKDEVEGDIKNIVTSENFAEQPKIKQFFAKMYYGISNVLTGADIFWEDCFGISLDGKTNDPKDTTITLVGSLFEPKEIISAIERSEDEQVLTRSKYAILDEANRIIGVDYEKLKLNYNFRIELPALLMANTILKSVIFGVNKFIVQPTLNVLEEVTGYEKSIVPENVDQDKIREYLKQQTLTVYHYYKKVYDGDSEFDSLPYPAPVKWIENKEENSNSTFNNGTWILDLGPNADDELPQEPPKYKIKWLYEGYVQQPQYERPFYDPYFQKVTSIDIEKSNRFNIISQICENFKCWANFDIYHSDYGYTLKEDVRITTDAKTGEILYYTLNDEEYDSINKYIEGKRQIKKVSIREAPRQGDGPEVDTEFKYGENLNSIKRTIDSNQLSTYVIVETNDNESAVDGFCTIARAKDNYSKENAIINLDYMIQMEHLNKQETYNDLYGTPNNNKDSLCYNYYMKQYNTAYDAAAEEIKDMQTQAYHLDADLQIKEKTVTALESNLEDLIVLYNNLFGTAFILDSNSIIQSVRALLNGLNNGTLTGYTTNESNTAVSPVEQIGGTLQELLKSGVEFFTNPTLDNGFEVIENVGQAFFKGWELLGEYLKKQIAEEVSEDDIKNVGNGFKKWFSKDSIETVGGWIENTLREGSIQVLKVISNYNPFSVGGTTENPLLVSTTGEVAVDAEVKVKEAEKLFEQLNEWMDNYSTALEDYDKYLKEWNKLDDEYTEQVQILTNITTKKRLLYNKFFNKYSRFIQEGTWQSSEYIDDDQYYADALSVAYTSSRPQITYDISVVDLSTIKDYYDFKVGQKTYVYDEEFFGTDTNGKANSEEVIISEISYNFDDPTQTKITVKNYQTRFEDLFQRITASVQSLQYTQDIYQMPVGVNGTIDSSGNTSNPTLKETVVELKTVSPEGGAQDVQTDANGITVTSKDNPSNILKIVSGGIYTSTDGGATYINAVTNGGINASLLTAGQINTQQITITNGDQAAFRWDKNGISAYSTKTQNLVGNISKSLYDYNKFVRYDQYGLYGVDSKEWNPTGIDYITNNASFGLTWNGFFLNGKKGYSEMVEGEEVQKETTTKIDKSGITIEKGGQKVFYVDNSGNLVVDGNFTVNSINAESGSIGDWTIIKDSSNKNGSLNYSASDGKYSIFGGKAYGKYISFGENTDEYFYVDKNGKVGCYNLVLLNQEEEFSWGDIFVGNTYTNKITASLSGNTINLISAYTQKGAIFSEAMKQIQIGDSNYKLRLFFDGKKAGTLKIYSDGIIYVE